MKTVFCVGLLAFLGTMAAALPARAQVTFTIGSRDTGDAKHMAGSIQVSTNSTTSTTIAGRKIRYYLYEKAAPLTWTTPSMTPSTVAAAVYQLDRTYTGPGSRAGTKSANYVLTITVPSNTSVDSTHPWTVSYSVAASDNRDLYKFDDYSWSGNTDPEYVPNPSITFQNGTTLLYGIYPTTSHDNQMSLAQQKIKHVIFIMQENRSFDNYFGTFPNPPGTNTTIVNPNGGFTAGVNGVSNAPAGNRSLTGCNNGAAYNPGLLTTTVNPVKPAAQLLWDLPHGMQDAKVGLACSSPAAPDRACSASGALRISDFLQQSKNAFGCTANASDLWLKQTVGYYQGTNTSDPLYNYWSIAKKFNLQDAMFEPAPSWSQVSHLFMVSGWSATCHADNPSEWPCAAGTENYGSGSAYYGWQEITELFRQHSPQVTWGYYKGENYDHNCQYCGDSNPTNIVNNCFNQSQAITSIWSPLPDFNTVYYGNQTGNVQGLQNFLSAVGQVTPTYDPVPQVSWIVPSIALSEHDSAQEEFMAAPYNAPYVNLKHGEAYVTMVIQQIMKNPTLWNSSVIFLAWDDWGGYYDHVRPPTTTINGTKSLMYGIRVPAMTISPWLGVGALDHQTLSFDAYLKFVEDLFMNPWWRVGTNHDTSSPNLGQIIDGRTAVRENEAALGDLFNEFDFNKTLPTTNNPPSEVTSLTCRF